MKQLNCWEFMKCGREEGGMLVEELGVCPAFPDYGNCCATVVGTFCNVVLGVFAAKYTSCLNCEFYQSEHYDKRIGCLILPNLNQQVNNST